MRLVVLLPLWVVLLAVPVIVAFRLCALILQLALWTLGSSLALLRRALRAAATR